MKAPDYAIHLRPPRAGDSPEMLKLKRNWNDALENPRPGGRLRKWKHRELVMLGMVPSYTLSAKGRALRSVAGYERRQAELFAEQDVRVTARRRKA
jgi:hypothetical protein